MPYVCVGAEAFPLSENLMMFYRRRGDNYVNKVDSVVKTTCVLHNYFRHSTAIHSDDDTVDDMTHQLKPLPYITRRLALWEGRAISPLIYSPGGQPVSWLASQPLYLPLLRSRQSYRRHKIILGITPRNTGFSETSGISEFLFCHPFVILSEECCPPYWEPDVTILFRELSSSCSVTPYHHLKVPRTEKYLFTLSYCEFWKLWAVVIGGNATHFGSHKTGVILYCAAAAKQDGHNTLISGKNAKYDTGLTRLLPHLSQLAMATHDARLAPLVTDPGVREFSCGECGGHCRNTEGRSVSSTTFGRTSAVPCSAHPPRHTLFSLLKPVSIGSRGGSHSVSPRRQPAPPPASGHPHTFTCCQTPPSVPSASLLQQQTPTPRCKLPGVHGALLETLLAADLSSHFVSFSRMNSVRVRASERECVRASWSKQRWNERAGKKVDHRENPPTSGIVMHDSHLRKSGSTRPEIEPGSPWWEASSLTAWPSHVECIKRGSSPALAVGMVTTVERRSPGIEPTTSRMCTTTLSHETDKAPYVDWAEPWKRHGDGHNGESPDDLVRRFCGAMTLPSQCGGNQAQNPWVTGTKLPHFMQILYQSLDINPIEHLCDVLEQNIRTKTNFQREQFEGSFFGSVEKHSKNLC
ncbi:hypothetical protein PR048_017269 [Dryococelus australis]|uniref:Uncharacterized protein n=1 Tax=Dryococelus australis TaxID=614101 RepID=A0ABQ9H923_9NEOP|nr:hypothetical protein PR048_017269 [Dryococelus australis]